MFSRPRNVVIGVLAISILVGFFFTGAFLYKTFIGLNSSGFPAGEAMEAVGDVLGIEAEFSTAGLVIALLSLVALMLFGFFAVRGSVRAHVAQTDPARRSFLTGAASGAGVAVASGVVGAATAFSRAAFGVGNDGHGWMPVGKYIFGGDGDETHPEWLEGWKGSRIRTHRRLGRTDWKVSDIVLGTGQIRGEDGEQIARLALERGVNYFDTSPDYSGSGSEQAMGRALGAVSRDKLFIATKFCTPDGHVGTGSSVASYKEAIESSLRRLSTDYVDLAHIHSCDEVDRLMDPAVHEAFDRLKQEGKVRFLGFSSHTPNLESVVNTAVDSGRFDVMMLAYHHGIWAPLDQLIHRARKKQDMGVVAMKTLKGAKHHGLAGFREESGSFSQAALRWVLSNPDVSCAVISFFKLQHVDEYLHASGGRATERDLAILRKYDQQIAGGYCSPHCGVCLDRCPEELSIPDVLRHRMYFEDYGQEKEAMRLYAALEKNASRCASCSAPCLGSCPVGVPIQERMSQAHDLLTVS